MKTVNRFFTACLLLLSVCTNLAATVNPKPFVIPELKEWKGAEGTFVPTTKTRIVCPPGHPELLRIARLFAEDYETMFACKPEVIQDKAAAGDFVLALRTDKKLGKEGYSIKVTDRVQISAPEPTGIYWGS